MDPLGEFLQRIWSTIYIWLYFSLLKEKLRDLDFCVHLLCAEQEGELWCLCVGPKLLYLLLRLLDCGGPI